MRRKLMVAVATFGMTSVALAAPAHAVRDETGTPGERNCFGHQMAHVAQEERVHATHYEGIGGYLRYQREFGLDWTLEDVRDEVRWWCAYGAP